MGLDHDQVTVLKRCFDGFADEDGAIPADNVGNILSMMGLKVKPSALKDIIEEIDEDGKTLFVAFTYQQTYFLVIQDLGCSSLENFVNSLPDFLLRKMKRA